MCYPRAAGEFTERAKGDKHNERMCTYIVETMIVGIIRKGVTSNMKRDSSHAVGLERREDKV
jgi:hypothetical protein